MSKLKAAYDDPGPPPWFGYKQVEEAPYPMTHEEFMAWPREPGYKYELHDGMCARLWRGPDGFCGGYAINWAYQPASHAYRVSVPELPGCEVERAASDLHGVEDIEHNLALGQEMIEQWMKTAWEAATTPESAGVPVVPLPRSLEEPPQRLPPEHPEEQPLAHLKAVGLIPIGTQMDYRLALSARNGLRERVGNNQAHPLAAVLEVLAGQIEAYEKDQHPI